MNDGDRARNPYSSASSDLAPHHRGTPLPDYVNAWVSTQRWFGNKGQVPALRSIGHFTLESPDPTITIRVDLMLDTASLDLTLYQVPTTERVLELAGATNALITVRKPGSEHARYIYDAAYDPAFASALLQFMTDHNGASFARSEPTAKWSASARGHDLRPAGDTASASQVLTSRVLSGEQSSTSIIVERTGPLGTPTTPLICKIFRIIHAGENPDVMVQTALAAAGSNRVPLPYGAVEGQWDDPAEPSNRAVGHLAFAQEFLPDAPDAWRTALVAAASRSDFTGPAFRLGQATAQVHHDLARTLPTREATSTVIAAEMAKMRLRCRQALNEVPVLADYRESIEAVFVRAESVPWPKLQRIHGDFHLGQVLDVPHRGWVLLDFEGEPLRSLRERTEPDIALRDVAGMLRSFSYVAGAMTATGAGIDRTGEIDASGDTDIFEWATTCREAFLTGYAECSGIDLAQKQALLDAFELDKALYEAVYEVRNRPTWLPIPLAAIKRLVRLSS